MRNKILIVEDEPIIADELEALLTELGYDILGIALDAEEAIEIIESKLPELVLLDISLDGDVDGVMLAEIINEKYKIPFVFLTSHTDKLTVNRVKRTNPSGFLVKPYNERELVTNVEIALYQSTPIKSTSEDFFIKDGNSLVKVNPEEILFAQADDNYTIIFTTGKKYTLSSTLKKIESKLPSDKFIRVHRSYIINLNKIDKITDGYVIIKGEKVPIGRNYQADLYSMINKL
ncbi:MAG: DNA-binding LytR/AlgR family response regulator [Crocinitomix sp.]